MIARLGGWSFQNPRKVIAIWVLVIVAVFGAVAGVGAGFSPDPPNPRPDSAAGTRKQVPL